MGLGRALTCSVAMPEGPEVMRKQSEVSMAEGVGRRGRERELTRQPIAAGKITELRRRATELKEKEAEKAEAPELTRAQKHFQSALKKITALRTAERERRRAANMPFEAESAGSRFKKVLREALKIFPTKNPTRLREAMQNDSSSDEGSSDEDGFSDAGSEMEMLVNGAGNEARQAYRATCVESRVLPSSRALVSLRNDTCDIPSTSLPGSTFGRRVLTFRERLL